MITQNEFNVLLEMEKIFDKQNPQLPSAGEKISYSLHDISNSKHFDLDIDRRGKIEMKSKLQNRYEKSTVLVRLEINSRPHMNPDGEIIGRNHIHVYKEGFDDRWAYELKDILPNLNDSLLLTDYFEVFCNYCHIELPKNMQSTM